MRISDWSSDVCSSDLKGCCTSFTGGHTRNSSTGSIRHSPLSDFWPETRPVLIAFMSVWRVTPTFSDASLREIPIVSLAVKLACIVSIYRLHRHRALSWMHGACYLGQRSEEHTSELQSLMRTTYAVFSSTVIYTFSHTLSLHADLPIRSPGSRRHSPLSGFWPETRAVLIAFMSVWRVTPTFSDASLRVIPIVSLAVKLACIVSIYRLHRHRAMSRMHGACYLGQ